MHRTRVMPSAGSRRCMPFLMDMKMKKLALLWFAGGTVACAAPASTTYLDNAGRRMPILMTTTANANGVPLAAAYRNAAGQWQPTTVVQQICGVDAGGMPQPCNDITQSMINVAGGIAGLDNAANMTAPVLSPAIATSAQYIAPGATAAFTLPMDKLVPDSHSMFTLGQETAQFGGLYDAGGTPIHRAVTVIGQPYGNYNAGCTLCIFSTSAGDGGGGGQAGISGTDYRAGASAVSQSDFAAVGFYHFDENWSARVTAQVASFAAGTATLATPMTAEQMATLHAGMYVATNVINPGDPTTGSSGLLRISSYHGYLKSWDAGHLYVYDWAVPGDGNSASGQVPDVANLDSTITTYTVPMVWVGVPDKHFAENEYMVADGSHVLGNTATSIANAFEREEFDFRASNWSKAHSVSFHGWTTSFECDSCVTNAMDEGSYAYLVNGPMLPLAYRAQLYGDAVEYSGYSTMLGSNGAPEIVNSDGSTTNASASVPAGTNHVMASFASSLPSNNTLNFSVLSNKEQTTSGTWVDYGIRMGLNIDGNRNRQTGLTGGTMMGALAFNYPGHLSGVCTMGGNVNLGLCTEGDGTSDFAKDVTFNGSAHVASGILENGAPSWTPASGSTPAGVSGQGTVHLWNQIAGGAARTEIVNVDPTNGAGGFAFYNINSNSSVSGASPLLSLLQNAGATFNVHATLASGASIGSNQTLFFNPANVSNNLYPGLTACDSYTICLQGNIGANLGILASSIQGGAMGSRSFWQPDGHGNWHASSEVSGGGAVSNTAFTLASLPTANETDGAQVWCSDCRLNGIAGVEAFWHSSVSRWTDSQNNALSN
jgi:hypothetical protein